VQRYQRISLYPNTKSIRMSNRPPSNDPSQSSSDYPSSSKSKHPPKSSTWPPTDYNAERWELPGQKGLPLKTYEVFAVKKKIKDLEESSTSASSSRYLPHSSQAYQSNSSTHLPSSSTRSRSQRRSSDRSSRRSEPSYPGSPQDYGSNAPTPSYSGNMTLTTAGSQTPRNYSPAPSAGGTGPETLGAAGTSGGSTNYYDASRYPVKQSNWGGHTATGQAQYGRPAQAPAPQVTYTPHEPASITPAQRHFQHGPGPSAYPLFGPGSASGYDEGGSSGYGSRPDSRDGSQAGSDYQYPQ